VVDSAGIILLFPVHHSTEDMTVVVFGLVMIMLDLFTQEQSRIDAFW
jgi:hypothetical protein